MDDLVLSVWVSLHLRTDSPSFLKLYGLLGGVRGIYDAGEDELRSHLGSRSPDLATLCDKDLSEAERIVAFCREKQIGLVAYGGENYPKPLLTIPAPPPVLYYRGTLPDFDRACPVAVVGTRKMTEYGKYTTFNIARDLSLAGAMVVSGMALGVDGVAHAGALAADAPTVAVLGSGIDVCYPPEHLTLARQIVKKGCILTEYAPGTKPDRYRFPARNRIVSGLARATLVIEGREKSGALITAHHAIAQGRPLYALPGNVDAPASLAPNLLIRNGAKLCLCADDIVRDFEFNSLGAVNSYRLKDVRPIDPDPTLDALGVPYRKVVTDPRPPRKAPKTEKPKKTKSAPAQEPVSAPLVKREPLPAAEEALLAAIPAEGDVLIESLVTEGRTLREVMRDLLKLEIKGLVTTLPGERVRRS